MLEKIKSILSNKIVKRSLKRTAGCFYFATIAGFFMFLFTYDEMSEKIAEMPFYDVIAAYYIIGLMVVGAAAILMGSIYFGFKLFFGDDE